MAHDYTVAGGVGGRIPGAYWPGELDSREEWVPVRPPRDLLDAALSRLGSEGDPRKVVLAVLAPLRSALEGAPLGALLAKLPQDLARELADAELNLRAFVPPPHGAADYVHVVSRLVLHPPDRASVFVRAVFAAAKAALDPEDSRAVEARLPPEIGALFRAAR